ncbi:MAG: hypothetical protein K940chlam7_00709 [Chlamydiae bacterium]|nr:hypothetical protein [Chlamydiota bacterium]
MKFTITGNHRQYFRENERIEFEGLLSEEELTHFKAAVGGVLAERLGISYDVGLKQPATKFFEFGRDLWRDSSDVKKITCQRRFGEIAYQLIDKKPLRLGYDQYLPPISKSASQIQSTYADFLQTPASLEEISSLRGLACGWLLCLSAGAEPLSFSSDEKFDFPIVPGNAVFLSPKAKIDFPKALLNSELSYYMIVYTSAKGVYIANEGDTHPRAWKKLGYNIGDRLSDKLNPIIYR